MLRVGVVGARRIRQGTGEFIAKSLAQHGCEVSGIVGQTKASVEEARRGLRERHGIEATGYTSVGDLLARERPDALVIASPAEHHLPALQLALLAGCHVFCEKPLFWSPAFESREANVAVSKTAEQILERARNQERLVLVNTQWPETMLAFDAVHPTARKGRIDTVEMWLSPMSQGVTMIVDSAPHVLSLLHNLCGEGEGELRAIGPLHTRDLPRALDLRFDFHHSDGVTGVTLHLRHCPEPPRPAAYAINGHRVDRVIEAGYKQFFVSGERRALVPDPTDLRVQRFLREIDRHEETSRVDIVDAMEQLAALVSAVAS